MKNIILYLILFILILVVPRSHADTATNSDFNPFPQMEEDMNQVGDQTPVNTDVQNDEWPPANSEISHE